MAGVPAARETVAILRFLGQQAGPTRASVLVRELELPRSTVYHLLTTLVAEGFVTHVADEKRYALGLAAYELGTGYARQAPLQRLARVPLADLVDRGGHTAHLAVRLGREVVYVIEERAPGRPPLVTDVGVRLPAEQTASGRAMLAELPAAAVRALFPDRSVFATGDGPGPRTPSALRTSLVEVRRRGWAVEDGEVSDGLATIAAAVRDHAGQPVAAVAVTFPTAEAVDRELVAAAAVRTARVISQRLGG